MILKFSELYGSVSLQTLPRPGRRAHGVAVTGPFDIESHTLANALAGQGPEYQTIELTGSAATIEVVADGCIAWVGAGAFQGSRFYRAGETIKLPYPEIGCRSYLAMSGGIETIGGHCFESGSDDRLRVATLAPWAYREGILSQLYSLESYPIRIIFSPDASAESRASLLESCLEVDPNSNRIGIRIKLKHPLAHCREQPSEPTDVGVVQLPPSGNPIILGPDGPTIGGYPRIGTIAPIDLGRVGQLRGGSTLTLEATTWDDAKSEWEWFQQELQRRSVRARLNSPV